jgi:ankyrin repeat protein
MPVDNDLHKAAHKGDLEACKAIIAAAATAEAEEPIGVNDPGASDRRALHRAAGAGHLEVCQYFLEIGAEVDAVMIRTFYYSSIIIISFYYYILSSIIYFLNILYNQIER